VTYLEALSIMKLKQGFTDKDLKEAFRAKAKKAHPDHSGCDEDFKLLKIAYDYLRNNKPSRIFSPEDTAKLNLDITSKITIEFHDACTGCVKKIRFPRHELYTNHKMCSICSGRGWICRVSRPLEKCNVCNQSRPPRYIEKNIRIPAGIVDGNKLSFKGEGNSLDKNVGVLNISISVNEAESLTRSGQDIIQVKDVKYSDLLLGKSLVANTVHGDVKVDIPFGSFDGDVLRVKGRGIKSKKKAGHHIIKLRLIAPAHLTIDQKKALETLRSAGL